MIGAQLRKALPGIQSAFGRFYCSQHGGSGKNVFEKNRVVLCGKAMNRGTLLESGWSSVLLRTMDEGYKSVHLVLTEHELNVDRNQTLFVDGYLHSNKLTTLDNKTRNESVVRATDLSLVDVRHQDINFIELKAPVASDITEFKEFSLFSVATHYFSQSGEDRTDFHWIRVHDAELRESLQQGVSKGDIVYLTGRLDYQRVLDETDRARSSCTIRATNVWKMAKGARGINENASKLRKSAGSGKQGTWKTVTNRS